MLSKKCSAYNRHTDTDFIFALKKQICDFISLFGSDNVVVLSVDGKAIVPIDVFGITKQAPVIMHVGYEIRLSYSDFVKATKYRLTLSVYATCLIKPPSLRSDLEITYSGPT